MSNLFAGATRPLVFFDLETTGSEPRPNVTTDRAVTLAVIRLTVDGGDLQEFKFNPQRAITREATSKHGITDAMVKEWPTFKEQANAVLASVAECDLGGFNIARYDVPLLWEEFHRCGLQWFLEDIHIIDVEVIFKLKEPRTLDAAKVFYLGAEAAAQYRGHDALADTQATAAVFQQQLQRYSDLGAMDRPALAAFCMGDKKNLDAAGTLLRDADGDAVYGIGKNAGMKLRDDPGFAQWMLGKDFSAQTKYVVRRELRRLGHKV